MTTAPPTPRACRTECLALGPDQVGESPVWDGQAQRLWWVDIDGRRIRQRQWPHGALAEWALPERVACIALTEQADELVAAMESRIQHLRLLPGGAVQVLRTLAHITHPQPNMRFNDGRCDASGRLWVGTMVMDMSLASPAGGLYCLDERGLSGPHVSGLITPNGSGMSPDGRWMYLSDSHPQVQQVWRMPIDLDSGRLGEREPFIDFKPLPGRPDGAAVDARGHYWICGNDAGMVHEFDPTGRWLQAHAVPFAKPAMCAFAGPDLSLLCVTSIVPGGMDPAQRGASGQLVGLSVGQQGRPEPRFTRFPRAA